MTEFDAYCARGAQLVEDKDLFPWSFIDWWAEGEKYGEDQTQALAMVPDWSVQQLMNVLSAGRLIKTRKFVGRISFEHHRTVARRHLDKAEQEWLLGQALEKGLTVVEFRKLVKGEKPRDKVSTFEYHMRRAISALRKALETADVEAGKLIEAVIGKLLEAVDK
jgi:hypothetical protein